MVIVKAESSQAPIDDAEDVVNRSELDATIDKTAAEANCEQSPPSDALVKKIRETHREIRNHAHHGALKAIELGKHLIAAQGDLPNRRFSRWFHKQDFEFTLRTAKDYMAVARAWSSLSSVKQKQFDLTVTSVRSLKAALKPKECSASAKRRTPRTKQSKPALSSGEQSSREANSPVASPTDQLKNAGDGIDDRLDSCSVALRSCTDAAQNVRRLFDDDNVSLKPAHFRAVGALRREASDLHVALDEMFAMIDTAMPEKDTEMPEPKQPETGAKPCAITETAAAKATPSSRTTGRPGLKRK